MTRARSSTAMFAMTLVLVGGAVGTLARAGVADAIRTDVGQWPWATFLVNVGGAALLGWLWGRFSTTNRGGVLVRAGAGTGFCGGLTTFSALELQTLELLRDGHVGLAAAYAGASIAAGMLAAIAGIQLGRGRGDDRR